MERAIVRLETEVLAMLGEGAALEAVMAALAVGLERITESGLLASVLRVENGSIHTIAAPSLPASWCAVIQGAAIGPRAGSCGTAVHRNERVIVSDVETDDLWHDYREAARPFGLRACWSQPIQATDGAVLGTVALYYREPREPAPHEVAAIERTARVARIALERYRDDQARQRVVEELQATVRYNEFLVAMLGHDLRNPLSAVVTGSELLHHRETDEGKRRVLRRITSSGKRMGRMIEQILDMTLVKAGRGLAIDRAEADLAVIARSVASEIELAYPARRIVLDVSGDARGRWDVDRICQVFTNLLCNALDHGDPTVDVQVSIDGNIGPSVLLAVRNGGAIPEPLQATLFDPFRRGATPAAKTRGLGLGLFITKEIVEAHGARIHLTSKANEGTTFQIELPRGAAVQRV